MYELVKRLRRNQRGNVAMVTALALPVLILSIGGAADYARVLRLKAKLQTAVDSATLATVKYLQQNADASDATIKDYFRKHLDDNVKHLTRELRVNDVVVNYLRQQRTLRATVKADSNTTFMKFAALDRMPMTVQAEGRAVISYTEVALVLDVTGSMGWEGSSGNVKLAELKEAATEFINTLYDNVSGQPPEAFKVAIVPFAQFVNVGLDKRGASWLNVPQERTVKLRDWRGRVVATKDVRWTGCVGARDVPHDVQDDGYSLQKVQAIMNHPRNPAYPEDTYEGWTWDTRYEENGVWDIDGDGYTDCVPPIQPLVSLKDNRDQLLATINGLQAKGWTYIPGGLMWGWRVLSPEEPFTEGADDYTVRRNNVRKIIVLMTDGANTVAPDRNNAKLYYQHYEFDPDYANSRTTQACNNIKATDPGTGRRNAEIITITFDIPPDQTEVKALMQQCASMGWYDASSGQLKDIFKKVASKLLEVYLSQ